MTLETSSSATKDTTSSPLLTCREPPTTISWSVFSNFSTLVINITLAPLCPSPHLFLQAQYRCKCCRPDVEDGEVCLLNRRVISIVPSPEQSNFRAGFSRVPFSLSRDFPKPSRASGNLRRRVVSLVISDGKH